MNQPLVSIVTPCYNGETYLTPFLDSLLAQTYKNVELIFIDDASTDKTAEILEAYKPRLEKKGWKVIYYKRAENGGVAKAINDGLTRFTGKYLAWPDSDDILYPHNLERRVEYMESHPDCSILFNQVDSCTEGNYQKKQHHPQEIQAANPPTMERLVGGLMLAPALCTLIRSADFIRINPTRQIYDKSTGGQNYQLVLPMVYAGKVGCLEEILACYVERKTSHYHNPKTELKRKFQYYHILLQTLKSIDMPAKERSYYRRIARQTHGVRCLRCAARTLLTICVGEKFVDRVRKLISGARQS